MNRPAILAMVLAGGRVDELGVLTHHRPKSAVPFGGFASNLRIPGSQDEMNQVLEYAARVTDYAVDRKSVV